MAKLFILFLTSLLFVLIKTSGKKSIDELGISTRLPDNKMPKEF